MPIPAWGEQHMSLVYCRDCKHAVSDSAEGCPRCGARHPALDAFVAEQQGRQPRRWAAGLLPVAVAVLSAFGWHYRCLPATGQTTGPFVVRSVNPITNDIVVAAPANDHAGHRTGVPHLEEDLLREARENFDVWGILVGYGIRVDG